MSYGGDRGKGHAATGAALNMRVRAGEEDAGKGCDPVTLSPQPLNILYISDNKNGHGHGHNAVTLGHAACSIGGPGYDDRLRAGVDLEEALWWAVGCTGRLPWCNPHPDDLAMDCGFTVIPKHTRHLYSPKPQRAYASGGMPRDAFLIVEAVKALPGGAASMILECARGKVRPDCMLGIEPREVTKPMSWRKAAKKRKAKKTNRLPVMVTEWEPCKPEAICAARAAYARWHNGMGELVRALAGQLIHCQITGFSAPAEPWNNA